MNQPVDHTRRAFLGLRSQPPTHAIRPPWSDDASLSAHCTGCGACITACPERILHLDTGGLPQVDFTAGACTLCGGCAESCAVPVFDRTRSPAWPVKAFVSDRCLPKRGILCESCRDVCLDDAIGFARAAGRAPIPVISLDDCTGCGACQSVCPARAITVTNGLSHG